MAFGGSKVVEYIIQAKDATARGVESAIRRIRLLASGKHGEVSVKAKVETTQASETIAKLRDKIVEVFGKANGRINELMSAVFAKFGANWGAFSDGAGNAVANIISKFTGMGSAGAKAIAGLGGGFALLGGLAVAAFAAWKKAITDLIDGIARKWSEMAQIAADNVRASAQSMAEAFSRVFRDIDEKNASLARRQANSAKLASAANGLDDSARTAAREREVAEMLATGASTAEVAAKREEYRREDGLVKLKQEELDIERQLRQIKERRTQRKANAAEISDEVEAEAAAKLRKAMDGIAKANKRLSSTDRWWSGKDRDKRIEKEVAQMTDAERSRIQAAKNAYDEIRRRRNDAKSGEENDDALEASLKLQREGLQVRREGVQLAQRNAEALQSVAEAEQQAEQSEKERAAAAERAAEQEKRAKQELAALDIDVQRAGHAAELDPDSQVLKDKAAEMRDYYERLSNAQSEADREETRSAHRLQQLKLNYLHELENEDRRAEAERARLEAANRAEQHRANVAALQSELREQSQARSEAQSRLSAANQKVAQAWTWYRDKDAMQAHIDDVLEQRAAEKQWEKDFKRLQSRFRGDTWKNVDIGKLSAEEEAVRQVALAKEEQAAAQKALDEIAENTRDLAEKLDELLTMKEA